jgi:aldehyde:ferredoxin oxidoreductase
VDLSNGEIWTEDTEKYAKRWIGGRGIDTWILFNEVDPEVKWSDPQNLLIFGVGALVGTLAPGACRVSVDTKNVFNNAEGSANVGGHWGAELKFAGFDNIVLAGKSEKPVYLWIQDGKAELRDAKHLWGKTTFETEDTIRREHGDRKLRIACIGPSGENRVKGSAIIIDYGKAAGGSGVGCVMGEKKLKAIAVRGHGTIKVAKPDGFMSAVDIGFNKVRASPGTKLMQEGTLIDAFSKTENKAWSSGIPVRNHQDGYWETEKRERITGKGRLAKYRKSILACFNCPIGCIPFSEITDGKYKNTKGPGFWVNSVISWASNFDVTDLEAVLAAHLLANQLGIDGDNGSAVISWAFECYEKGLLTKNDTEGLELKWGDGDVVIEIIKRLAYRKGIGELLALGAKEASEKLGKGSEKFACYIKGQDTLDEYRVAKGWGLAISTSPVAGRHLRGSVGLPEWTGPRNIPVSEKPKPTDYEGQAKAVYWESQAKGVEDMLGICSYVGTWYGAYALDPSDYARLTSAAFGAEIAQEEIMRTSAALYNLEKAFNTLHAGFTRNDDYPPRRLMEEPVKSGPYKGFKSDKERWDKMLDEFYALWGWDKKTSWQTRKCLVELGMEDVAEKLAMAGKLI